MINIDKYENNIIKIILDFLKDEFIDNINVCPFIESPLIELNERITLTELTNNICYINIPLYLSNNETVDFTTFFQNIDNKYNSAEIIKKYIKKKITKHTYKKIIRIHNVIPYSYIKLKLDFNTILILDYNGKKTIINDIPSIKKIINNLVPLTKMRFIFCIKKMWFEPYNRTNPEYSIALCINKLELYL
uniref:Uncharacterized protein n=1 Tax=viral metagenome TaxID=1070528 RepID=A0A6C0EEH4_9ZZZZ